MKTFTVAGTSVEHGIVKFRVANDIKQRMAMLVRCDNTDIRLVELPEAMSKQAAAQYLLTVAEFADAADVISGAAERDVKQTAPRAAKEPKQARKRNVDAVADEADVVDDDGFVEPKDEAIQVAMARKAREYPGLSARQLYEMVMLTVKRFGDTEPNF
jgi:hypothetical protein